MNSAWENVYDEMKDRRYGRLFFATLLIVVAIFLLAAALNPNSEEVRDGCLVMFPIMIFIAAALIVKWIRAERRFQRERLRLAALSRDELAKAKLKLKRPLKPMRFKTPSRPISRAAPRAPDTYLKY